VCNGLGCGCVRSGGAVRSAREPGALKKGWREAQPWRGRARRAAGQNTLSLSRSSRRGLGRRRLRAAVAVHAPAPAAAVSGAAAAVAAAAATVTATATTTTATATAIAAIAAATATATAAITTTTAATAAAKVSRARTHDAKRLHVPRALVSSRHAARRLGAVSTRRSAVGGHGRGRAAAAARQGLATHRVEEIVLLVGRGLARGRGRLSSGSSGRDIRALAAALLKLGVGGVEIVVGLGDDDRLGWGLVRVVRVRGVGVVAGGARGAARAAAAARRVHGLVARAAATATRAAATAAASGAHGRGVVGGRRGAARRPRGGDTDSGGAAGDARLSGGGLGRWGRGGPRARRRAWRRRRRGMLVLRRRRRHLLLRRRRRELLLLRRRRAPLLLRRRRPLAVHLLRRRRRRAVLRRRRALRRRRPTPLARPAKHGQVLDVVAAKDDALKDLGSWWQVLPWAPTFRAHRTHAREGDGRVGHVDVLEGALVAHVGARDERDVGACFLGGGCLFGRGGRRERGRADRRRRW